MRIKKFNEEIGFDDEDLRDRLEIANLKGELEPGHPSMKQLPLSKGVNTGTELKKIVFKYPILDDFHINKQDIDGTNLVSFYATSKKPIDGEEYYCQVSFAYTPEKEYYIGFILRKREDYDDDSKWKVFHKNYPTINGAYNVVTAFLKACNQLGVIDDDDISFYNISLN